MMITSIKTGKTKTGKTSPPKSNRQTESNFTKWWFGSNFALFLQGRSYVWWVAATGFTLMGAYYNDDPLCWGLIAYFLASTGFIYGVKTLEKYTSFKMMDGSSQWFLFVYIFVMEVYEIHPVVPIVDVYSLIQSLGYIVIGFGLALICAVAINKTLGLRFNNKVGFYIYFGLLGYYTFNPIIPVFAQSTVGEVAACNTGGLLGNLGSFTINLFSSIEFGSVEGSNFSSLICQVIGLLIVGLLVVFIGLFGYVMYQVNIQQQPYSVAIQPILGFVTFAGSTALAIQVMIGDGTIDGGGGGGEIEIPTEPDS